VVFRIQLLNPDQYAAIEALGFGHLDGSRVKFRKQLIQDLQEEILKGRPDNLSCVLLHDSFQLAFVPHK
jgi:hypothetical protein